MAIRHDGTRVPGRHGSRRTFPACWSRGGAVAWPSRSRSTRRRPGVARSATHVDRHDPGAQVRGTLTAVGDANYLLLGPPGAAALASVRCARDRLARARRDRSSARSRATYRRPSARNPRLAGPIRVTGDLLPERIRRLDRGGQATRKPGANGSARRCRPQGRAKGSLTRASRPPGPGQIPAQIALGA